MNMIRKYNSTVVVTKTQLRFCCQKYVTGSSSVASVPSSMEQRLHRFPKLRMHSKSAGIADGSTKGHIYIFFINM